MSKLRDKFWHFIWKIGYHLMSGAMYCLHVEHEDAYWRIKRGDDRL